MKKKKYDTSVVMLYLLGREHLLPQSFRDQIPYSTISSWRKADYSAYAGHEFRFFFEENFEYVSMKEKLAKTELELSVLIKAYKNLNDWLHPLIQDSKKDKELQKHLVNAVNMIRQTRPLKEALECFGITRAQYYQWSALIKFKCGESIHQLCMKKFPRQLHKVEIQKIKTLLSDPHLDHWPIVSVAGLALRKGSVIASLFTWYKYAKILNLTHPALRGRKKLVGLEATKANEYLHVDCTYYDLNELQKVTICFVMDNYSKMILGFAIGESINFEVVKAALIEAIEVIKTHPGQKETILVADGGKENHNKHIDEFISNLTGCSIKKIRALKDIAFSNSPVEAIHRIIKGRYLRKHQFSSVNDLHEHLVWSVNDYNCQRPHYKHTPRTPSEVYYSHELSFDVKERLAGANLKRIRKNQKTACDRCQAMAQMTLKHALALQK